MGEISVWRLFWEKKKKLPLGNKSQVKKLVLFGSILFLEGREEEIVLFSDLWVYHWEMLNFLQLKYAKNYREGEMKC